ncbi:hypothetical protein ACHAWT_007326 [Skeletonema menzelii]
MKKVDAPTIIIAIAAASAASAAAFIAPSRESQVSMPESETSVAAAPSATITTTNKENQALFDDNVTEFVCNDIGAKLRQEQVELQLPSDYDTLENDILASLFGSNEIRNDFFRNILGRRVAYFPRQCTKNQHQLLEPPMSGFDLSSMYESNDWISLRKRGSQDRLNKEQTSYNDLTDYIAGGGSAVIPVTPDDYLHNTKMQIDTALGIKGEFGTSMNIYHSGPSAVALNIHYDSYPVIVLQLEGQKEWIIQNDKFGENVNDITDWRNVTLTEGDLLYIPKGVYHAATGDPEHGSTHVTIGFENI